MSDNHLSDETAQGEDALSVILRDVINKRDERRKTEFLGELAKLAEPDRETVSRVTPDKGGEERTRTVVSRFQPTDRLYQNLYRANPEMRQWRTPDLDHWNAEWLRGMVARDRTRMLVATEKSNDLIRATTLEGALDVSDPTAILAGTGGHLLPQGMSQVVMIARDNAAVLPRLVQNFTMTSGTLRIPTAGAVTAAMASEGSTAAQGEPTFVSEMLKAQKAQAFMKASVEMVADSAFNLVGIYAQKAGEALGALEDTQICTSNGTAPNISEAIAGGNVDEATTTVLIYEDLVTLYFALGKTYRTNAVLVGSVTLTLLSQLMDGNDRPVLSFPTMQPNVVTDAPGAIGSVFSKSVYEVPLADGTLIFGDVAGYALGRRAGITAAVSEHADFSSDLVNFKFTERMDGRIVDDVAMKQMSGLATVA